MRFKEQLKNVSLHDLFSPIIFVVLLPFLLIHRVCLKISNKKIILVSEDPSEARDNGFVFYKYLVDKQKIPNVYYAITKNSPDRKKFDKSDKLVAFYGIKHWFYYFNAFYNISIHKASSPAPALFYVLQKHKIFDGNRVFLQHGVIMNKVDYLHQNECNFRYFITAATPEHEFVKKTLGYDESNLKLLGLPRHDLLTKSKTEKDYYLISIIPTWRKYLMNLSLRQFMESNYYKSWNSFLMYLKKHEYNIFGKPVKFYFYLHRNFMIYQSCFVEGGNHVKNLSKEEVDIQYLIKKSDALITDYSSVSMDFAYNNRPVFYYQFDRNDFFTKHLEPGYFDYYRDGFGPVCIDEKELICELKNFLEDPNRFEKRYASRSNNFFAHKDEGNCERIYRLLFKEE